jgi:hypothetical protein
MAPHGMCMAPSSSSPPTCTPVAATPATPTVQLVLQALSVGQHGAVHDDAREQQVCRREAEEPRSVHEHRLEREELRPIGEAGCADAGPQGQAAVGVAREDEAVEDERQHSDEHSWAMRAKELELGVLGGTHLVGPMPPPCALRFLRFLSCEISKRGRNRQSEESAAGPDYIATTYTTHTHTHSAALDCPVCTLTAAPLETDFSAPAMATAVGHRGMGDPFAEHSAVMKVKGGRQARGGHAWRSRPHALAWQALLDSARTHARTHTRAWPPPPSGAVPRVPAQGRIRQHRDGRGAAARDRARRALQGGELPGAHPGCAPTGRGMWGGVRQLVAACEHVPYAGHRMSYVVWIVLGSYGAHTVVKSA